MILQNILKLFCVFNITIILNRNLKDEPFILLQPVRFIVVTPVFPNRAVDS